MEESRVKTDSRKKMIVTLLRRSDQNRHRTTMAPILKIKALVPPTWPSHRIKKVAHGQWDTVRVEMAEFLECKLSFLMSTIWIWKDRCRTCFQVSQATDSWLKSHKLKTMRLICNNMFKVEQRLIHIMAEEPLREINAVTYPFPSLNSLHRSITKVATPNTTSWIHHLLSSNRQPHRTLTQAFYSLREWKSSHRLSFRLTRLILPYIVM